MAEKLMLFGEEYQLTEGITNYSKLKTEFEKLSSEYGTKFIKEVTCNEAGVKEIVERAYKIAQKYFDNAEEVILNILAENNVYTVTKNQVKNVAISSGVQDVFEKTFSNIEEAYYNVVNEADMARERREIRKESRARFVGGGFGLQGAMKGIVQASMLNAATGLGHSFINAIGNSRTERQMREQLEDMYITVRLSLNSAFGSTIKNYFVAAMILLDNNNAMSFALPSKEDEEQAKAIVENLEAGRIPENKIQSVSCKALMLNPFINSTYFTVIEKCGDSNQEIEKFADAHGMNGQGIKTGIIRRNFEQKINDVCENYEDHKDYEKFDKDLTKIKTEITKFKKFIGLKAETEYESKINRKLKKIEAEFKTVEGVVFKNLKDVKAAKADIQKFYEYIAVNGIGSETIIEDVRALDFKTKIITDNLEERINKMKTLTDDKELGKCIKQIFNSKGFKTTVNEDADIEFADKIFIIKTSKGFSENASKARKLAGIPTKEKIILIFKNELTYADDFTWWVLTNCNLYMFDNDDDKIKDKKVIPYINIGFIHADREGNLSVRNKNGVDITSKLELEKKCRETAVRDKLTDAIQEVYYLIAPFNEGRKKEVINDIPSKDLVELDIKILNGDANWKMATMQFEDLKKYACINDKSSEYNTLLKKAQEYWNCDFADETVYFVLVESQVGTSLVFTSKRLYIYGSVESNKNKYVFPIERVSTFQESYGKYGYAMFFDSVYFSENYFKCGYGYKGENTLHFEVEKIPRDEVKRICYCLKTWIEKITYKFVRKENFKKEIQLEIKNADNLEKSLAVLEKLNADTVLEAKDRDDLFKQAQTRVDKYQNSNANKEKLKRRIDALNQDDLAGIGICLRDILSNDLFDDNDAEAVTRLFDMQQRIVCKIYKDALKGFFTSDNYNILISGKPVYTSLQVKDISKKLADVFIGRKLNIEHDEVPLVYFENPSQYSRLPDKFTLPSAKKCIVTNKRLIVVPCSGSEFIYTLDQVKFESENIRSGYVSDLNDKLIPFDFPYMQLETINDRAYKKRFKSLIKSDENNIVSWEFIKLKNLIIKKNDEIAKVNEAVSKIPADTSVVKSYTREKLEKEYTYWNQLKNYNSKIIEYATLIENTIKEIYQKEITPLCVDLENKSVDELEALVNKLDKEYSNKKLAHLIEKEKNAVKDELNKKKAAIEEERRRKEEELIKNNFKNIIEDYPNKTEDELKTILLEIKKYPKEITNGIEIEIEKVFQEKVASRIRVELDGITEGYENWSASELKNVLLTLEQEYKKYLVADEYIQKISERKYEILNEVLLNERVKDEKLGYFDLLKRYEDYSRDNSVDEYIKKEYTLELKERIIDKIDKIVSAIRNRAKKIAGDSFNGVKNHALIISQVKHTDNWQEPMIVRIKDEKDCCIVITSKEIIVSNGKNTTRKYQIKPDTKFDAKKGFLSSEVKINGINIGFTVHSNVNDYVTVLNAMLDALRESRFFAEQKECQNTSRTQDKTEIERLEKEKAVKILCENRIAKRKDEYDNIRPVVSSVIPTMAKYANIIGNSVTCGIMQWEGPDDVVEKDGLPLMYVFGHPSYYKSIAMDLIVNGKINRTCKNDNSWFYMFTTQKLVVQIKDKRNEWEYSEITDIKFKKGIFSTTFVLNNFVGIKYEYELDSSFQVHADAIKEIYFLLKTILRNNSPQPALDSQPLPTKDPTPAPQLVPTKDSAPAPQPVPTKDLAPAPQPEPTPQPKMDAKSYVNNLPSELRAFIIGTTHPKFSKKVKNAIKAYACDVKEEEVVAMMDTTIFESGKEGFVMTSQKMVIKSSLSAAVSCVYSDINGIRLVPSEKNNYIALYLETTKGVALVYCGSEVICNKVAKTINDIAMITQGFTEAPYKVETKTKRI